MHVSKTINIRLTRKIYRNWSFLIFTYEKLFSWTSLAPFVGMSGVWRKSTLAKPVPAQGTEPVDIGGLVRKILAVHVRNEYALTNDRKSNSISKTILKPKKSIIGSIKSIRFFVMSFYSSKVIQTLLTLLQIWFSSQKTFIGTLERWVCQIAS